jgi:hypothetical protein
LAVTIRNFYNDCFSINNAFPVDIFGFDLTQTGMAAPLVVWGTSTVNLNGTNITTVIDSIPLESGVAVPTSIPNLGFSFDGLRYSLEGIGPTLIPAPVFSVDYVRLAADTTFQSALSHWTTTLGQTIPFPYIGAVVVRIRVNADYQSQLSVTETSGYGYKIDKFVVTKVKERTESSLQLELGPVTGLHEDDTGIRKIHDGTCSLRYRHPDATTTNGFIQGTLDEGWCPYTGSTYFTPAGTSVTNWQFDQCGRKDSDCKLRFTSGARPFTGKLQ